MLGKKKPLENNRMSSEQTVKSRLIKQRGAPEDKGKKSVTVSPQKKCDRCLGNYHARNDCPSEDAICHACEKQEGMQK